MFALDKSLNRKCAGEFFFLKLRFHIQLTKLF